MDRWWFLTWTTYGERLSGDPRGSVLRTPDLQGLRGPERIDGASPRAAALARSARSRMRGPRIRLREPEAELVLASIQSQAEFREWSLAACAVMANHVHVVVGVPGDPPPGDLLRVLKAYASRDLNLRYGRPASGTRWTQSGSTRLLDGEAQALAAVEYVRNQVNPLALWAIHRS